jgi:flavodoxin
MKVITHSRSNFYQRTQPIYWYEFIIDQSNITLKTMLNGFLNVHGTKYYEFDGNHDNAIKELTKNGIIDIVEGNDV